MLIGEYHHNIDEKGRLIIPAKYREEIGSSFVVTKGLDGCLYVYSLHEWERITSKLKTLPFTKKSARTFTRFLLSGASICEFDKQGRINLVSSLTECVIIGVNDRLEIWDLDKFNNLMSENESELDSIAEGLFEGDFDFNA